MAFADGERAPQNPQPAGPREWRVEAHVPVGKPVARKMPFVLALMFVPAGRKNHAWFGIGVEPRLQAGVAQLVEHLICNQRVGGSNPFASSRIVTMSAPQGVAGASQTRRAALLEN